MANNDIRSAALSSGVKLWQIADALHIADSSLSRKLRHELPTEEKAKILNIINQLYQNHKNDRIKENLKNG